jgi:predicted DsbA family dithiol-disulfide isomerase
MPPIDKGSIEKYVEELIEKNKIVIFSKTTCPWCAKVKELFKLINEEFVSIELDLVG